MSVTAFTVVCISGLLNGSWQFVCSYYRVSSRNQELCVWECGVDSNSPTPPPNPPHTHTHTNKMEFTSSISGVCVTSFFQSTVLAPIGEMSLVNCVKQKQVCVFAFPSLVPRLPSMCIKVVWACHSPALLTHYYRETVMQCTGTISTADEEQSSSQTISLYVHKNSD